MKFRTRLYGGCFLLAALLFPPGLFGDTAHVAEDAHIDLGNPQDANGVVPNLVVSNVVDRKTGERLTFVMYDLPPLPGDASLEQAFLRLFVGKVAAAGDIDLYRVIEPWEEHGISGLTAPDFEAAPFTTFPVTTDDEGHFLAVDVTPEVQDWLDGAEPNHGFVLVPNPGTDVDVSFDSKENGQTAHASELELVLGTASGGVDSDDIADDSIMSSDIQDESIVGADILDGSIGSSDVDKDAVQLRVAGTCAAGSSIREIDNMGAVTCEPDDDSGGDITSVQPASGGGLQGGADSGDAELGIAQGGVDSSMIADGSIVAADVDATSLQVRVGGSCPAGESIRAIAPDGAVTCEIDDDTDTTLDPEMFWKLQGNSGTSPLPGGSDFVGTVDGSPLVLGVNNTPAIRLSYVQDDTRQAINVLGGHPLNEIVDAMGATIAGGGVSTAATNSPNQVESDFATISGGLGNLVTGRASSIGGGDTNLVESQYSTISGGAFNRIDETTGRYMTIAGGHQNQIVGAPWAFVGGGYNNSICDPDDFLPAEFNRGASWDVVIAGGGSNKACSRRIVIGGGYENTASAEGAMIVGGRRNMASGLYSLAAGSHSEAHGDFGAALGSHAISNHVGAFVWADASSDEEFASQRANQFRIRAQGGARFDVGDDAGTVPAGNQWVDIRAQHINTLGQNPVEFRLIDTSTGAYLSLGGGWVNASDRNRKTDIRPVDRQRILERLAELPVESWRYKVDDETVRHVGPMAQDFHAAFGFGGDPRGIMSVDADGVALAAIQALYHTTQELERRTRQLEAQQQRLDLLETRLQALEARLGPFEGQRLARAEIHPGSSGQ